MTFIIPAGRQAAGREHGEVPETPMEQSGLEPPTSSVRGMRSPKLSYCPIKFLSKLKNFSFEQE